MADEEGVANSARTSRRERPWALAQGGEHGCGFGGRVGSWPSSGDGADDTPLTVRGCAVLRGDELRGMIFIHQGDDSGFVAKKAKAQ